MFTSLLHSQAHDKAVGVIFLKSLSDPARIQTHNLLSMQWTPLPLGHTISWGKKNLTHTGTVKESEDDSWQP